MHICFVNHFFLKDPDATITGPMVQTYLLGAGLARRGWTVDYVATTRGKAGGTTEMHDGIRVHYVTAARRLEEIRSARAVERKLHSIRPDVFYQRGRSVYTGATGRAARRCGAKFVWAISGDPGCRRGKYLGQQWKKLKGLKRLVYWPIYAWADRFYEGAIEAADVVLAQTEYQRQSLRSEFGRDSIVLQSGHPVPPESVLKKLRPPVVVWVGALKKEKRPELFVDLANRCSGLDAKFVVAGKAGGPEWSALLTEAERRNPRFTYRGEIPFDQVDRVFAEASLLVNTSDFEGLPNTFVQAWLHGVTVLSLHVDPDDIMAREQIGNRTETFEALVDRTRRLIGDSRAVETMGRKAHQVAEREFGLETILTRLESIIRSL